MPYIIAQACIDVKDHACVEVCPVDCIHPREDEDEGQVMLYIDPDECIDCGVCEPECPVEAIYMDEDVPDDQVEFIEMNADYYTLDAGEFEAKWGRKP